MILRHVATLTVVVPARGAPAVVVEAVDVVEAGVVDVDVVLGAGVVLVVVVVSAS